ncbi:DUF3131 domain-containing protein [Photobacterium sanguinicancri]|uniref:DUF3131 domain-containing protein n=1 Tax=Photobacterium sanguinicancri TaxID=875932 RepID=A0AAW7Y6Y4_9GAMM|nr:DUF3131 domain-containing protein [Photobacterium sanguinicancri]MDO6544257.1 DUF3131 domain-containing protein [Photobacterium sanguinicancri]
MKWFPYTLPHLSTVLVLGFVLGTPLSLANTSTNTTDKATATRSSETQSIPSTEAPSFFGGRAVTQAIDDSKTSIIEFQRRSISPAIITTEQQDVSQTDADEDADNFALDHHSHITRAEHSEKQSIHRMYSPSEATKLSREDLLLIKKARYYIDRNWNSTTGLIDSVQGYSHATMWDVGSSIGAILALEYLGEYTRLQANGMLEKTLTTLVDLPLYKGILPNRQYNTKTGQPSGSLSQTKTNGDGWSALDIGRLLIWLNIAASYKPELADQIDAITEQWNIARSVHQGTLFGEHKSKTSTSYRQEGRLGYLQYAAQGFAMEEQDVSEALGPKYSKHVTVDDEEVYIDIRNLPYFTTDPYVLQAIELGYHDLWWNQLDALYSLHKNRYDKSQKLTIFAEDALSQRPWFAYNNIYFYGKSWLSTSPGGKPIENGQAFSNKVAFGLSVLYKDSYSQLLYKTVVNNSLNNRSIPTGLFKANSPNTAYNINTNSLILVSLWYKQRGFKPIFDYMPPSKTDTSNDEIKL